MREALESVDGGKNVMVAGEVSGFKVSARGHWSFDLVDPRAKLKVMVFLSQARRLSVPKDGDVVVVTGLPTYNAEYALAQMVAKDVAAVGDGDQKKRFEALKARLAEAGFFDVARKRPLPLLPRTVGIVTSLQAAAFRDVLKVIKARNHTTQVLVRDARVQGDDAPADVADAIRRLDASGRCDVILVVRGGGSRDDLSAFDTEPVVRAVVGCSVPVVSGVGHEVDVSLCDLAADVRAATPSQAAELAVPEKERLERQVGAAHHRLNRALQQQALSAERRLAHLERRLPSSSTLTARLGAPLSRLERRLQAQAPRTRVAALATRLDALHEALRRRNPASRLSGRVAHVASLSTRLDAAIYATRDRAAGRLDHSLASLDALSPLSVLRRGWALVTVPDDNGRVALRGDLAPGARLHVRVSGGGADVVVDSVDSVDDEEDIDDDAGVT
jgi:exodeoxyribonuclease VII large subunit